MTVISVDSMWLMEVFLFSIWIDSAGGIVKHNIHKSNIDKTNNNPYTI